MYSGCAAGNNDIKNLQQHTSNIWSGCATDNSKNKTLQQQTANIWSGCATGNSNIKTPQQESVNMYRVASPRATATSQQPVKMYSGCATGNSNNTTACQLTSGKGYLGVGTKREGRSKREIFLRNNFTFKRPTLSFNFVSDTLYSKMLLVTNLTYIYSIIPCMGL